MAKATIQYLRDLSNQIGTEVARSEWLKVTQARIDQFADATNDRQCLIAGFALEAIQIADVKRVINYGLDKVRFISPVPVDSLLRAHFVLINYDFAEENSAQVRWNVTIELEGVLKPACVAEIIFRYYV